MVNSKQISRWLVVDCCGHSVVVVSQSKGLLLHCCNRKRIIVVVVAICPLLLDCYHLRLDCLAHNIVRTLHFFCQTKDLVPVHSSQLENVFTVLPTTCLSIKRMPPTPPLLLLPPLRPPPSPPLRHLPPNVLLCHSAPYSFNSKR